MDRDSFISFFPYAVVLAVAPAALALDLPVVAIAVCVVGLILVGGFFGGCIQLPLMVAMLGEIAVGVVLLLPGSTDVKDTLKLVVGVLAALVWLVLLIVWLLERRDTHVYERVERALDTMPLGELIASLGDIGIGGFAELEIRIKERAESAEDEAVPLIIERYRGSKRWAEKDRLLKILGALPGEQSMAFLKHLLDTEKDAALLRTAVKACGRTARADMVPGLSKLTDEQDDRFLWLDAFQALGRNGTPEAFESIRRRLVGMEDPEDREWAMMRIIEGAGKGRSAPVVDWLAEVARQDQDAPIRVAAATALGFVHTPEALRTLNEVLEGHWDRELWKDVLVRIDWDEGPVIPCVMEVARDQIATLRGGGDRRVMGEAMGTLLKLHSAEVQELVAAGLDEEQSKPPEEADAGLLEDLRHVMADWD